MLVVVMERDCADPKTWIGPVGAALGTQLYIDCKDINEYVLDAIAKAIKEK